MFISLITDEYSGDPATAFELGRRWGIEHYEIRTAYRWRMPTAPAWAVDCVAAAVKNYGVKITGISPGLFKPTMRTDGSSVPINDQTPQEVRRHLDELLEGFFKFAERLGTRNITVFSLTRSAPAPARNNASPAEAIPAIVIDALAQAAQRAQQAGFQLLLENVSGAWADTAGNTLAILKAVNSPALRLTWDPANAAAAEPAQDPLALHEALLPYILNLHVKDAAIRDGKPTWVMLGEGIVDWKRQFALLRQANYAGPVVCEQHLQYLAGAVNLVAMTEEFVARLRKLMG